MTETLPEPTPEPTPVPVVDLATAEAALEAAQAVKATADATYADAAALFAEAVAASQPEPGGVVFSQWGIAFQRLGDIWHVAGGGEAFDWPGLNLAHGPLSAPVFVDTPLA